MIDKNQAERLAASINVLRPDWPTKSIVTLLAELRDWPLRDLGVALAWIALDQDVHGNWISKTPARIKEDGPWLADADRAAALMLARQRASQDTAERKREIRLRQDAVAHCAICDHEGRLASGSLCDHELTPSERARAARVHADQARAALSESQRS